MKTINILSLGAGVQSTAILLLHEEKELFDENDRQLRIDHAIFADTGDEPQAVYSHLEWLEKTVSVPIHRVARGNLGDDLIRIAEKPTDRNPSIPAFTVSRVNRSEGKIMRQCTRDYKIRPIEQFIKRELLGLAPRKWVPKDVHVHTFMGFSLDEPGRAFRARARFDSIRWQSVSFPLIEMEMSRGDCEAYLRSAVPHKTPRSACVY